jgi:type VI secretion system secreted protein Hcp
MAVDMFMNMGANIQGETQDSAQSPQHDIDVLAWSWGMSQTGTFHTGGGGGAGVVNVQDLTFTKYVDKASAALMVHCCLGRHVEKCVLLVRKAGGGQKKYIEITMSPVMVTAISTGGSSGDERLTENVTLNFGKVKFNYFIQNKDGMTENGGELEYDIAKKKHG